MKDFIKDILNKIKELGIKKVLLRILIIIIIIIIVIFIYSIIEKKLFKREVENNNYTSVKEFESVREVAVYLGCDYIKEEELKDQDYSKKIYLKFNKGLYSGNVSNEEFFQKLAIYTANVLDFSNFIFIDESQNITIEVICDKEEKVVKHIKINGDANYYADKESRKNLDSFKNTNISDITINSDIINNLIKNNWVERKVSFGTKESSLDDYDIYFDEGIKVKRIGDKVFNVVFTERYSKEIVNNLKVGVSFENVKKSLGQPIIEDSSIIGYKGEKIYIFFEKDEVSIYRVEDSKNEEFCNIVQQIKNGEDIRKVASNLTDIWSDYDEYSVSGNQINITYSLRGVKFQYNVSDKQGIILYKNYTGYVENNKTLTEISKDELPSNIYIDKNYDLVVLKEQVRAESRKNYAYYDSQNKTQTTNEIVTKYSNKFYYTQVNQNGVKIQKFICIDKQYPDYELNLNINSYMWIDDYRYMYSIKNEGIYILDLKTRKTSTVVEGKENFDFKEYNSNELKYDDKTITIK